MSFRRTCSAAAPASRRNRSLARPLARVVSWLVISALLGLMVMPLAGAFAQPAPGVSLVTICTDHGTEQIALDAEGRSVPLEKHQHGRACPLCLSHSGNALLPAAAPLAPLPLDFGREVVAPAPAGIVPEPVILTGRQSRAPPAVIA